MNLLKNSIKETNENITSLGNTFCTTVLPTAPLQPLDEIEKSIQKKFRKSLWSPL